LRKRWWPSANLTVLMITHDMDVIAEACDRATVLYAGLTVEEGPTEAVLANPRHPYTQALLAALPDGARKGERLAAIEGRIPPPQEEIKGCAFAPRCPKVMAICATVSPPDRQAGQRRWLCHLEEGANG
jgi:peptide/nickel transport system ATP-binding protein